MVNDLLVIKLVARNENSVIKQIGGKNGVDIINKANKRSF